MMRKAVNLLLLGCSVAVTVLCAFLPRLALDAVDRKNQNRSATAPLPAVTFPSQQPVTHEAHLQKMLLLNSMYSIPVSPQSAELTEQEAITAAEEKLQDYLNAGLFSDFDFENRCAEAYLGIAPYNADRNGIFWSISFSDEIASDDSILVWLDDTTGKILYISYHSPNAAAVDYDSGNHAKRAAALAAIFFGQLDVDTEAYQAYTPSVEQEHAEYGYVKFCYTLKLSDNTQPVIQFLLFRDGFEIQCIGDIMQL